MTYWNPILSSLYFSTLLLTGFQLGGAQFPEGIFRVLNSNMDKYELILAASGNNNSLGILEILINMNNANTQAISIVPFTESQLLTRKHDLPLVVLIVSETEKDFKESLSNIVQILQQNPRKIYCDPIFFLLHPTVFKTVEDAVKDPIVSSLAPLLHIGTDVYFLIQHNSLDLLVVEAYSIRSLNIVTSIEVSPSKDLLQALLWSKTSRRSNFQRGPVIAVALDDPDYTVATKVKVSNTSLELESGFEVDLHQYFRDGLNFSEEVILGTGYVRQAPNGTLTGMAIQINDGAGDIAIGATEQLEYRLTGPDGISYIHPIFHSHIVAFFKQPPASSVRNIFTQTFTFNLWVAVFGLWVTLILVLKTFTRIKTGQHVSAIPEDIQLTDEAAIWATGVLCQQGWYFSPISTSMKITFLFGILFGLISYIAYSAALVSILSVEVVPIQSFADLLTEKFQITSDSHIPTAKAVVQDLEDRNEIPKMPEDQRNIEIGEKLQTLVSSKFAIVTIPDSIYPILQLRNLSDNYVCKTVSEQVVSSRLLKSSPFVRRGSPLKEFINYKLLLMQERGVKSRLVQHYISATSIQCSRSEGAFTEKLGLRDVFTAFVLLLFGNVVSFLVALAEKSIVAKLVATEYDMYE